VIKLASSSHLRGQKEVWKYFCFGEQVLCLQGKSGAEHTNSGAAQALQGMK